MTPANRDHRFRLQAFSSFATETSFTNESISEWKQCSKSGVIEEVRAAAVTSATASQMIGLREIRELLAGKKSLQQCIAEIQQATRRYAKRQLTWFRRQTNFLPLNLSFLTHNEAVKWISLRILSEARHKG